MHNRRANFRITNARILHNKLSLQHEAIFHNVFLKIFTYCLYFIFRFIPFSHKVNATAVETSRHNMTFEVRWSFYVPSPFVCISNSVTILDVCFSVRQMGVASVTLPSFALHMYVEQEKVGSLDNFIRTQV